MFEDSGSLNETELKNESVQRKWRVNPNHILLLVGVSTSNQAFIISQPRTIHARMDWCRGVAAVVAVLVSTGSWH